MTVDLVVVADDKETIILGGVELPIVPQPGTDMVVRHNNAIVLYQVIDNCWELDIANDKENANCKIIVRIVPIKTLAESL